MKVNTLLIFLGATMLIISSCNDANNTTDSNKEIISEKPKEYKSKASELSGGRIEYVPVYANFDDQIAFKSILSIRNISINSPIKIESIDLYDNDGNLIKEVISNPIKLKNLGSYQYSLQIKDNFAEIGGNYIVSWSSDTLVSEPLIEVVHYYVQGTLGFSFITSSVQTK